MICLRSILPCHQSPPACQPPTQQPYSFSNLLTTFNFMYYKKNYSTNLCIIINFIYEMRLVPASNAMTVTPSHTCACHLPSDLSNLPVICHRTCQTCQRDASGRGSLGLSELIAARLSSKPSQESLRSLGQPPSGEDARDRPKHRSVRRAFLAFTGTSGKMRKRAKRWMRTPNPSLTSGS